MSLSDICVVIDLDGFHVNGRFVTREIGYCSLTEKPKYQNQSYRFRLNSLSRNLSAKDWRTVFYCTRFVHGLSFCSPPSEKELYHVDHLEQLLKNVYAESKRRDKKLVGYKGGHVERDLLEALDIPHVNLENFGCPKYDRLVAADEGLVVLPPTVTDCGYHRGFDCRGGEEKIRRPHCPKLETLAFARWIDDNVVKYWD